jgi:hypothetical protein
VASHYGFRVESDIAIWCNRTGEDGDPLDVELAQPFLQGRRLPGKLEQHVAVLHLGDRWQDGCRSELLCNIAPFGCRIDRDHRGRLGCCGGRQRSEPKHAGSDHDNSPSGDVPRAFDHCHDRRRRTCCGRGKGVGEIVIDDSQRHPAGQKYVLCVATRQCPA